VIVTNDNDGVRVVWCGWALVREVVVKAEEREDARERGRCVSRISMMAVSTFRVLGVSGWISMIR